MADSRVPSRATLTRRRGLAIAIAVAAIIAAWIAFLRPSDEDTEAESEPPAGLSASAAELVGAMTTQQLADQVLLLGFDGTDATSPFVAELRIRQLGGVIVGPDNWLDSATGTALVGAIRAAGREGNRIPPLLVAAQEGGTYRALADLPPDRTELEIGNASSIETTEEWARSAAESLRGAGFDLDLFPVADVATLDSPVADRAFSDDPATVAALTAAAVRGCRQGKIACAPLHFPGLGAASQDTDRGPATVSLDPASLSARDLEPFRAAFAERAPAVVLSLAFYAAFDPVTPGALSEPIATGLLRDELGYEGVAITDDLGAGAVRSSYSAPKAAVAALAAGSDLIQIGSPEDHAGALEAIIAAVGGGELPEARLEQAAGRVLELKASLGLLEL